MEKVRWAIVGTGTIAETFVKDLQYIEQEEHSATCVVSRTKEHAQEFQEAMGIPNGYTTLDELIQNRAQFDIAYIATPHPMHYEACLSLLKAKVPVLCEKPMVLNEIQSVHLINKALETKTFLMEGLWIRFLPSILKVQEWIASGFIGDIKSITASMSYKAPYDPKNRYFNPELGGGSLLDLGIYPLYLSYLLLGNPSKIQSHAVRTATQVDGACAMLLEYKNGAYALLESSFIHRAPIEAFINGSEGFIRIGELWNEKPKEIVATLQNGSTLVYHPDWKGHGLYFEALEAAQCLRKHKIQSEAVSHHTSLELVKLMDTIRKQNHIVYPHYE